MWQILTWRFFFYTILHAITNRPSLVESWWTHRRSNIWHSQLTSTPLGDPAVVELVCLQLTLVAVQVENELKSICDDILQVLEQYLIPSAVAGESRVFYYKMYVALVFCYVFLSFFRPVSERRALTDPSNLHFFFLPLAFTSFQSETLIHVFLDALCQVEYGRVMKILDSSEEHVSCYGNQLHRKLFSRPSLTHCIALHCPYFYTSQQNKESAD